jgi:hypothetical protein
MTPADDLAVFAFEAVASELFAPDGTPKPFILPAKGNTQDDPFDRALLEVMRRASAGQIVLERAGPNTSPDSVLRRGSLKAIARFDDAWGAWRALDTEHLLGLEIKKLDKKNFRASPDFNSTPPCGVIRIADDTNVAIDCRGFYLFVLLEPTEDGKVKATGLALLDGDLLNEDFEFYLDATGRTGKRTKAISLGSYGDGTDRQRPMFIFPNPLALAELFGQVTLVHARADLASPQLRSIGTVKRNRRSGGIAAFTCYRLASHPVAAAINLVDPFVAQKS